MVRAMTRAAALLSLPYVFLLAGCPASPEPTCATTVLPDCRAGTDPFSDEACRSFDDALMRGSPQVDPARSPVIDEPAAGAVLGSAAPATFRWHGQLAGLRMTPLGVPLSDPPARAMTWRDELARWTTLVPRAYAHCPPFNGVGYALLFRSGGRVVLRVEQSRTEYTPDAQAWSTLRGAGGPIELTVLAARFRGSLIEPEGGPFASEPRRFTIAP